MIPAARIALQRVRIHWEDLEDALGVPATTQWPPAGLRGYLADLSRRDDLEERAKLRALERSPHQVGESAAPLSVDVLDCMQQVTEQLVECADHVASRVQRPAMNHAPRDWPAADRARRNQAAAQDAQDPRRWRYVGTRTAVQAACWLDGRLVAAPGPFGPLPSLTVEEVARVAQMAAQDVLRALELARQSRRLQHPCPSCREQQLAVQGGDGTDPAVICRSCGRVWRETVNA